MFRARQRSSRNELSTKQRKPQTFLAFTERAERSDSVVLALSVLFVYSRSRNGFSIPEDPFIMDFSYIWRALFDSNEVRNQILFSTQASLIVWAPISFILNFFGVSAIEHYFAVYLIRTAIQLVLLRRIIERFSSPAISIVGATVCFTATPLRVAPLYTHWWSHVVLILGIFLVVGDRKVTSRKIDSGRAAGLVVATLGVWANIPHLISAWIALPLACVLAISDKVDFQVVRRRAFIIILAAGAAYTFPLLIYLDGLDQIQSLASATIQTFPNKGLWLTIQGFAGWWYFDDFCVQNLCVKQEPLHFELTSVLRQILRAMLLVLSAWSLISGSLQRFKRSSAVKVVEKTSIVLTGIVSGTLLLAYMGNLNLYFELRTALPVALQIFREPYPKFSPLFYVMLTAWSGYHLTTLSLYRSKAVRFLLLVSSVYLVVPVFLQARVPSFVLSLRDWRLVEESGLLLSSLPNRSCVMDISNNRDVATFYQTKYPEKHAELRHLRVTWVNESAEHLDIDLDGSDQCLKRSTMPFAVLNPVKGKSPSSVKNVVLNNRESTSRWDTCRQEKSTYVTTYRQHCIFAVEVKTTESQRNHVYVDWFGDPIDLFSILGDTESDQYSLYVESFDLTQMRATMRIECSGALGVSDKWSGSYGLSGPVSLDLPADVFSDCKSLTMTVI